MTNEALRSAPPIVRSGTFAYIGIDRVRSCGREIAAFAVKLHGTANIIEGRALGDGEGSSDEKLYAAAAACLRRMLDCAGLLESADFVVIWTRTAGAEEFMWQGLEAKVSATTRRPRFSFERAFQRDRHWTREVEAHARRSARGAAAQALSSIDAARAAPGPSRPAETHLALH